MTNKSYCVYKITNDIDDKIYYGITNDFDKRKYYHFNVQREEKILYKHMKELGNEHFNIEILYDNIPTKRLAEKMETILIIGNKNNLNKKISFNNFIGKLSVKTTLYFELIDSGLSELRNVSLSDLLDYDQQKVILNKDY